MASPGNAAPEFRTNFVILPVRHQVFPGIRASTELPRAVFEELCQLLERSGASELGVVAMRRPKAQPAPDDLYEVGTVCVLVSNAPAGGEGDRAGGKAASPRVRLVLEGRSCFKVEKYTQSEPLRLATVELLGDRQESSGAEQDVLLRALVQNIRDKLSEMFRESTAPEKGAAQSTGRQVRWPTSPPALVGIVGGSLKQLTSDERQGLLEAPSTREQLELALRYLLRESAAQRLSGEIRSQIQQSREQELKTVMLQRQMQEVKKELDRVRAKVKRGAEAGETGEEPSEDVPEDEEGEDEAARLAVRLEKAKLPEEAMKVAKRELKRLKALPPAHPEFTNVHSYLELLSSLPWKVGTEDTFDLKRARTLLDEDHKGLDQVKRRLLEFLAVQKMRGDMKGPILCLHGPPGIGKTSLGRSVARALGRKFHRIALGGVKDEAEIRGHRRTYIGSMPGSIIQAMRNLGVNNPVILLDEIDKMAQNSMFNPQATLLEVLDPEQNNTFKDHYLNTPFDLSRALFICTANDASQIDRPLLDRMEIIELSGYTVEEKIGIAEAHLLPKQRRLHALEPEKVAAPEDGELVAPPEGMATVAAHIELKDTRLVLTRAAMTSVVTRWTSESGVRSLERRLAQICRWATLRLQGLDVPMHSRGSGPGAAAREAALRDCGPDADGVITVDAQHLPFIVGAQLFEPDLAERLSVGVAMGLSVSSVGGQLLFIEATRTKGSGRLMITGKLGKVMTESVETAMSLLRSRFVRSTQPTAAGSEVLDTLFAKRLGSSVSGEDSDRDPFKGEDVHVHFPAGAIPKDGPSAGVAVLLALASVLLDRPMRSDTAVTGEVTLRGHVLPVGGIRDKVLAAHRAGVKHVLLPLSNKRNVLEDIPARDLEGIQVHYMKHVDEALDWAFGGQTASPSADSTDAAIALEHRRQGTTVLPVGAAGFRARL